MSTAILNGKIEDGFQRMFTVFKVVIITFKFDLFSRLNGFTLKAITEEMAMATASTRIIIAINTCLGILLEFTVYRLNRVVKNKRSN